MLPRAARMRQRNDFGLAVRRGRRTGRGSVVLHYLAPVEDSGPARLPTPQVGFVVSRAVGNSVRRHRVVRQLRGLVRDRLDRLPAGCRLVVRAQPSAFGRSSGELGRDLDGALSRLLGEVRR